MLEGFQVNNELGTDDASREVPADLWTFFPVRLFFLTERKFGPKKNKTSRLQHLKLGRGTFCRWTFGRWTFGRRDYMAPELFALD